MRIGDRDVRVNLLMLFMEHELDVTLLTIAHLVGQLGDGVSLSVLHNGRGLAKVGAEIDALANVHFYEAGENLGVAGGRNYLLRTDECKAADVVMLIDNDVIPPVDYVRRSAEFLLRRDDTGVVGSSVVLFRRFQPHLDLFETSQGVLGQKVYALRHRDILQVLQGDPELLCSTTSACTPIGTRCTSKAKTRST